MSLLGGLKLKKLSGSLGLKECYVISKEFINEKGFITSTDL